MTRAAAPGESSVVPDLLKGRVAWIFGDDFDIDLVIGVENIKSYDPEHLRSVCMTTYDPDFVSKVRPGDVIVGGRNFGYGHPHYPAMIALRNEGIAAVIAESFAPGYWRGEIYQGMPLVTVPGISQAVERWNEVEVDWRAARVTLPASGQVLQGAPLSDHAVRVIEAGGGFNLLLKEHGPEGRARRAMAAADD
jgi:3-isopropylmalate/(R)-2-methylmalate dehydratase small subunit